MRQIAERGVDVLELFTVSVKGKERLIVDFELPSGSVSISCKESKK